MGLVVLIVKKWQWVRGKGSRRWRSMGGSGEGDGGSSQQNLVAGWLENGCEGGEKIGEMVEVADSKCGNSGSRGSEGPPG